MTAKPNKSHLAVYGAGIRQSLYSGFRDFGYEAGVTLCRRYVMECAEVMRDMAGDLAAVQMLDAEITRMCERFVLQPWETFTAPPVVEAPAPEPPKPSPPAMQENDKNGGWGKTAAPRVRELSWPEIADTVSWSCVASIITGKVHNFASVNQIALGYLLVFAFVAAIAVAAGPF
jgi:hypothetical protein